MTVDERDIINRIAKVEVTSLRHLRMLEEQKAWKREAGFEYIETSAEMDARRSRTNLVSAPFLYRKMFNPRRPRTPDEFTLEMRVDVEGLRMEIILLQPPQCDASPRRLPAIGTRSDEPGVSRAETATETEEIVPQASVDGVLRLNCRSPEQGFVLFQPDVGADDNNEATSQQATACEEFTRPPKKRQQQGMTARSTEQSMQFDRGRSAIKTLIF